MSDRKRQMHLGVFVLGTGNHSAGWRYEGADIEQLQPAGDADHRADRRARKVRSVLHLRRVGDGSRRPPVVRQPVRAAHPALGAQHGDDPRRPRRHGVDELRRAVPCRPRLRLARSSERRPRRLERGHQHPRQGRAQLQQDQARRARPALRDRERIRRRRARPVGFLGRRRRGRRQGERRLSRQIEGATARSQGAVLFGERPAQHRAVAAGPSGHHPGRRLGARAGAFGALGRPRVLRGQRRQGIGQGRLRQPEAARRQARPRAA